MKQTTVYNRFVCS